MEKKKDRELVSVIIPVYNVETYLDECMESVINQTYTNLEIILVNDGSTDGSGKLCRKWEEKDSRVIVFEQENKGQGCARNLGVEKATGEWIAFLDADDWWDLQYVNILHDAAVQSDAEVVDCNYCLIYNDGRRKWTNDFASLGLELPKQLRCAYNIMGVTRRLIKSSLFKEYVIEQPAVRSEDAAVGMLISLVARKVVGINDVLYFYRKEREGSTTSRRNVDRCEDALAAQYLIDNFKRNSIFEEHYDVLKLAVAIYFSRVLISVWMHGHCAYDKVKRSYLDVMKRNFIGECQISCMHIGSWNLMSAVRLLPYIQDINLSFQFSSLISIVSESNFRLSTEHSNVMRRRMIERDISSLFWNTLQSEHVDYLVMDLLEERHDILKTKDGYITGSDALEKCRYDATQVKIIKQGTEEWFDLWKEACDKFFERIKEVFAMNQIVVVKNFLTDKYGDINQTQKYENLEWIYEKNRTLERCYAYMEEKYPEINYIDISDDEYYFTDVKYEYGVQPWYLNTLVNYKLAKIIEAVAK